MNSSVWVFFYGGLINPRILDKVGMKPTRQEPATLAVFDIRISPYVNLVRSAGHTVFGVLMEVTHAELQHTYSQLKAQYLPKAVIRCLKYMDDYVRCYERWVDFECGNVERSWMSSCSLMSAASQSTNTRTRRERWRLWGYTT